MHRQCHGSSSPSTPPVSEQSRAHRQEKSSDTARVDLNPILGCRGALRVRGRGGFARRRLRSAYRVAAGQGRKLDAGPPAEHRRMQIHEHRADLRKLDLEALPAGRLEETLQLVETGRCGLQRHAEDVALSLELHVRAVDDLSLIHI